jgi:hypothetical protein
VAIESVANIIGYSRHFALAVAADAAMGICIGLWIMD